MGGEGGYTVSGSKAVCWAEGVGTGDGGIATSSVMLL